MGGGTTKNGPTVADAPTGGADTVETALASEERERKATHAAPGQQTSSTLKSRVEGAGVDPALMATVAASGPVPSEAAGSERGAPPPFGPYSKIEVLAEQGSIGLVARGYNDGFGRWELLKFLRAELAKEPEIARQFKREGRVLAQLSHPNVVQVFATYEVDGRTCLAMEFLEGQSLTAYTVSQGGRLPAERARELLLEAARGLAAAHEVALLHRDLKPDNLFVTSSGKGRAGGLKLIDFGLATAERGRGSKVEDPSLVSGTAGGTPLFMPPEVWSGREASARSDLYSLGLTFWAALVGRTPFSAPTLDAIRTELMEGAAFASVREQRPDVPPELAAIIDRLVQKRADRRFASADELVQALIAAGAEVRARAVPSSGPYRGLEPFSAAERDMFFGREHETVEIIERLRLQPAIVLVGPAACGKSSLALAGVAPAVLDGALGGGIAFSMVRVEPRTQPLRALAAALAPLVGEPEDTVLAALRRDPARCGELVGAALPVGAGALIVVDQLEQLATTADPSAAIGFATALASFSERTGGELRVLATLRAEQMDRLFAIEPLRALLGRGFHPVRSLPDGELRRAIEGPAHAAGYGFEDPSAPDAIIAEVHGSPVALSLVSFALRAWWQARDERRKLLGAAAWKELGGAAGAFVGHAESVVASMGAEERSAVERILPRLVSAEGGRARVGKSALVDPALSGSAGERALERLVAQKVLFDTGTDIELAHDALIKRWQRLRDLTKESGSERAFRERVAAAARDWDAQGRPDGMLWDDAQAVRLVEWFSATEVGLGQNELAFVEAVRRRAGRRRFLLRSLVAAVGLIAVVLAFFTQAKARRLSLQLDKANKDMAQLGSRSAATEKRLLLQLAELEVDDAPASALVAAQQSRELGQDPALDVVAWRASLAGLPVILPFHRDGAALLAFSTAGDRIVAASRRTGLRVYAANDPDARTVALPSGSAITDVAIAPDGKRAAIADIDGKVSVVTLDGSGSHVIAGSGHVHTLAWTSAGIVIARRRGSLVVAGADTGDPVVLAEDADEAAVAGARVAALGTGGKLTLFDTASRRELMHAAAPGASVVGIAPDGAHVLVGDPSGRLALFDASKTGQKAVWHDTPHTSLARIDASPDGQRWLTVDAAGRATLWSMSLERIATLRAGVSGAAGVAFTWLGPARALAIGGHDPEVRVVAVDSGLALGRIAAGPHGVERLVTDRDARWLVGSSGDGSVRAWSLGLTASRVDRSATPGHPACAIASDGSTAACISAQALQFDAIQGKPVGAGRPLLPPPGKSVVVAVGDGARHAAWMDETGTLARFDEKAWASYELGVVPSLLELHGSSATLALVAAGTDRTPRLFATTSAGVPREITIAGETPSAVAFGQEESRVAVGTLSGDVRWVDLPGGNAADRIQIFAGHAVRAIAVAPDPGTLAVADDAGHVAVASGSRANVVWSGPAPVQCLAWSRGSRGLVAGTRDGGAWLIDTETGRAIALLSERDAIADCARGSTEDRFFFATRDGAVYERTLDLDPVWMKKKPENPLDPSTADVSAWKGLTPRE